MLAEADGQGPGRLGTKTGTEIQGRAGWEDIK